MNWIQRRLQGIYEVRNIFYIRKVIRENRLTDTWKDFRLRYGYVNQIYTVVSLRQEDMGEEESVQKMKVVQLIEPINRYIESLNIADIVYLEISKLPDTRSWLITYWPMRTYFSVWRLIFQIIGIFVLYKLWTKLGIGDHLINMFAHLIN